MERIGTTYITYTYTYDDNGNILSVSDGTYTTSYVYDSQNQLIRENNQALGKSWTWTYDAGGNITCRKEYAYTTGTLGSATVIRNNLYGDSQWGDLITSYCGFPITRDDIGNVTGYYGWTYTWKHGRQLATASKNGVTWTYSYDANGMRTSRSNGTTTYQYYYSGDKLTVMTKGSTGLSFTYDAAGNPLTLTYNGTKYYYNTNLQGDVTGIIDSSGATVVTYIYDAWGRPYSTTGSLASTLGADNPLRYRGYVYDSETWFYYLQSRYYSFEWGKFISADAFVTTDQGLVGNNMFAYCGNNPVNRIDPAGEAWWHWALGAAVVAACAVATVVTCGGFAAAAGAVAAVGSGVAAATTASTIAAGAFIGSATVYGMAVLSAASTSNSVEEFNGQGNWGTVAATAFGGLTGGYDGYTMSKAQATQTVADDDTFLPDSFYSKHAPKQSTPNSSYTNYTYNNYTGKYEKSTAYYDFAGRQNIRIDWTNHGYSNHGNPHVHYTTYNSQYRDGFTIRWD